MDDVAEEDKIIATTTEVDFAQVAFEIVISVSDPEPLGELPCNRRHFGIIDHSHPCVTNGLCESQRPGSRPRCHIKNILDSFSILFRERSDSRSRCAKAQR